MGMDSTEHKKQAGEEKVIHAVYSAAPDAAQLLTQGDTVSFYICPKERISSLCSFFSCPLIAAEDLTKTPTWLWCNEAANEQSVLIYDRMSRYYRVSSEIARRLEKLAEAVQSVYLVDIIPFCEDIQYLYMPWRYINRSILGYAHYYAFRENYAEMQADGTIVRAHDHGHLSKKLAPHCRVERPAALIAQRQRIEVSSSEAEQKDYSELRNQLFEIHTTPQPIITRLADYSHASASRRALVCDVARSSPGRSAIICNLSAYASWYRSQLRDIHAICCTYNKPDKNLTECDRVIYAEPPIVQSFRIFDIEALLPLSAHAVRIQGALKVDVYLDERLTKELSQIDAFTRTLWSTTHASV